MDSERETPPVKAAKTIDPNKEQPIMHCPDCQTNYADPPCRNCGSNKHIDKFFECPDCNQPGMEINGDTQHPDANLKADCNNCEYHVEIDLYSRDINPSESDGILSRYRPTGFPDGHLEFD